MEPIEAALKGLGDYCRTSGFCGWDVFDGLNSSLLQSTPLYRSSLVRLAWIQFFKRSPVNLRAVARVPKGCNAKGLALFASGLLVQRSLEEARALLERLESVCCTGYEGWSWGYDFDWESRAFYVKKGTPNLVTTVFVANSFLDYFDVTGDRRYLGVADDACKFILHHLVLEEDDSFLCFRYIPGEAAVVHNAYMLGAALLGRVFRHTRTPRYLEASTKAMRRGVKALRPDGSWFYGERGHHQFVDNFHTGFNLVALNQWMLSTGDRTWEKEVRNAYRYWMDTFFLSDGRPKYYNDSLYPIDIHCSAQGIVTCLKLQEFDPRSLDLAARIARWAIENMQDRRGYFYYQRTRWYTNKVPYMRWSQAWMFYALSLLIAQRAGK